MLNGFRTEGQDVVVCFVRSPVFDGLLCFKWFRNSCQVTGGMWPFLVETGHVGEWDRTSSTGSLGGGVIWMPSKMKQGVPKNFSYICRVTQKLLGSWISDNERLQVFGAEGASNSAFHLDSPDQTTVKLSLRFGFVRGP